MNKVFLTGRIATEPEIKVTEGGSHLVTFTLAVKRNEEKTDFIICKAWSGCADYISQYCVKGQKIMIDGSLSVNKWQKDDGSTVYQYNVNVNRVENASVKLQNGV